MSMATDIPAAINNGTKNFTPWGSYAFISVMLIVGRLKLPETSEACELLADAFDEYFDIVTELFILLIRKAKY